MSIQAYQTTAQKTESPRQTEYRAFAQATRGLIDAAALPETEIGRRTALYLIGHKLSPGRV